LKWQRPLHLLTAVGKYGRSLRYLRPSQLSGLAWNRVLRTLPPGPSAVRKVRLRAVLEPPLQPFLATPRSVDGMVVTLLNHSVDYSAGIHWNDPRQTKLWRYCLHYMACLRQEGMTPAAQRKWMHAWVAGNPHPRSEGWEPFPTSQRLTNWFKIWWAAGFLKDDEPLLASAYAQTRHLRRFVERHIDVNHLFENLKTLFWAGCMFAGAEAEAWRSWAALHLARELRVQVLSDGGHYERSPMYHSLVLEGCLDLLNIRLAWAKQHPDLADLLVSKVEAMLVWLDRMTHPDGEIALFNDAAFKIAPAPGVLFDYGQRLGFHWPSSSRLSHLQESGYVVIRDNGHYLVMDIGPIGPEHQPGHGHCDLLSFEWSIGVQRIVCDSGVYAYQDPVMRPYVRSTAAHNTLRIDGEDQSEIWKEFRVARRAHPQKISVETAPDGTVHVAASHDGYRRLPGRPIHRRGFTYHGGRLSLRDHVTGSGVHDIEAFIHFHPEIAVQNLSRTMYNLALGESKIGQIAFENWQEAQLVQGWHCPEFGRREPNTVLKLMSRVQLPFHGQIDIKLDRWPA